MTMELSTQIQIQTATPIHLEQHLLKDGKTTTFIVHHPKCQQLVDIMICIQAKNLIIFGTI